MTDFFSVQFQAHALVEALSRHASKDDQALRAGGTASD